MSDFFGENTLFIASDDIVAAGPPWKPVPPNPSSLDSARDSDCYCRLFASDVTPTSNGNPIPEIISNSGSGDSFSYNSLTSSTPPLYSGNGAVPFVYSFGFGGAPGDQLHLNCTDAGLAAYNTDTNSIAYVFADNREFDTTSHMSNQDNTFVAGIETNLLYRLDRGTPVTVPFDGSRNTGI